jgi:hypothetical protein
VGPPLCPVEFSSLRSLLLGARPHSHGSLSGPPGLFIYSSRKDSLPPFFGAQCAPPSFPCVFIDLIACYSMKFPFFSRWRLICPGGYANLAQGCLWEYRGTAKLTLSTSSQAIWAWATGGPGALLVSLFNVTGNAVHWLEVWRGQSFASSLWFSLQGMSPASLQDFTLGGTLSAPSL